MQNDVGCWGVVLYIVVREGFLDKVLFELIFEGSEGVSFV